MSNLPKKITPFVKISEAAKSLGVSIDTLRRWEKAGKIEVIRTPGGTRLYSLSTLKELTTTPLKYQRTMQPEISVSQPKLSTVEDLITHLDNETPNNKIIPETDQKWQELVDKRKFESEEVEIFSEAEIPTSSTRHPELPFRHPALDAGSILYRLRIKSAMTIGVLTTFILAFLLLLRLTNFNGPAGRLAQVFNFNQTKQDLAQTQGASLNPNVLAASAANYYLDVNSDVVVEGDLAVAKTINSLTLTPNADGFSIAGGDISSRKLTVAGGDVTLDQDVSTKGSPSFVSLVLPAISKQISMGGGGTLTWTPTGAKIITFPDATGTVLLDSATQTLTNKTISGSDNTISNIQSSALSGSYTGITGLGTISTGTWNGTTIGISYGGTGLTSYTKGDVLYASATDTLSKLSIGSSGQVLTIASGLPSWAAAAGSIAGSGTSNYVAYWSDASTLTAEQYLSVSRGGSGVGTLTGVIKGNGTSAFSAMTGTTSYVTRWTDANTLGTGVLYDNGTNVGIGTTAPLGALHVAGQCVAKGTRIRRRRKSSSDGGDDLSAEALAKEEGDSDSVDWDDVPVEDIKPGDEVLSLNEKTGKFEWRKVEKTWDKGRQETIKLVTQSGKWIETTSEHPYLVKVENSHQKTASTAVLVSQTSLLNDWIDNLKRSIQQNLDFVKSKNIMGVDLPGVEPGRLGLSIQSSKPAKPTPISLSQNTNLFSIKWIKVFQLKKGMDIATVDGFEKIVSIKKTGRKQTYDLQIEGTHNFVGNDIVAHNTAIFGAGEGSTPTTTTLRGAAGAGTDIAGANFTFDASNGTGTGGSGALIFRTAPVAASSSTANTLAEIMRITPGGNVGIGTTSPGQLFTVGNDAFKVSSTGVVTAGTWNGTDIAVANGGTGKSSWTQYGLVYADTTTSLSQVGIGTSGQVLKTNSSANGYEWGAAGSSSQWTTTGNDIYYTTGNVGIGTTSPGAALDVTGVGRFSTGLTLTSGALNLTATSGALNLTGLGASTISATSANLTLSTVTSGTLALTSAGALNLTSGLASAWALPASTVNALNIGSNLLTFDTQNSRIGIGTTAPSAALDIAGATSTITNSSGNLTITPASNLIISSGNVGIGTVSPLSKLGVLGNASIGATYGAIAAPTSGLIVEGNVGIGTTAATAPLDIVSTAATQSRVAYDNSNYLATNVSSAGAITFDALGTSPSFTISDNLAVTGATTLSSTLTLPNSNTLTGVASYLQAANGISVGGATTYYINSSGTANLNAGTFAGTLAANGIANIGDAGDAITLSGTTVTLTANGAGNDITANLVDNNTDALDVQQGTDNYININTTNSSENIAFGNATTNPKFLFLGSGNVGIGITVPAYKLDIATAVAGDRGINIANTAATGTNYGVYSSVTGGCHC